MNTVIRANAFTAFGVLSTYGVGQQSEAFLEQVLSPPQLPTKFNRTTFLFEYFTLSILIQLLDFCL